MSASSIKVLKDLSAAHHSQAGHEELARAYDDMLTLLDRKLYHQLTVKSLELVKNPFFSQPGNTELLKLSGLFKELEPKAKALSMAQIAIAQAGQHANADEAVAFLEQKAADLKADTDSYALLKTMAASNYTAAKKFDEAKVALEEVQGILEGSLGLDPVVYSQYYRILSIYHKEQVHAGQFYKSGLLYLAYTPLDSISLDVQRLLARDLALAGLAAEEVYGLGELLSNGVMRSLEGNAATAWLLQLCDAYNGGRIAEWRQLRQQHASAIAQHNSIILAMDMIERKIALLALVELVWSRPADGRSLAFADIAKAAHIAVDQVEMLVMHALALGVLRGEIDEIRQLVLVNGVQSRVLSPAQIVETRDRVKLWKEHVRSTVDSFQESELAEQ